MLHVHAGFCLIWHLHFRAVNDPFRSNLHHCFRFCLFELYASLE